MKSYVYLLYFLIALMLSGSVMAQYNAFNQRDDQYRLLGLKRAKEAYEVARSEYERQKHLFEKELITEVELQRGHNVYADAEVNYQQSLLAVLFEEQYISVKSAIKYHASDGSRRVKLTLANTSGGSAEFRKLINIEDKLFRSLQPDLINNVYVSLMNDGNAIISEPYELKINELRYGEPREVDFKLLQDLDAVTVYMIYSNGNQRSMKIFLQKDATVNKVAVQSERFSQEVELGSSANYDLTLELFSGVNNTYTLEVVNLPEQIGRHFKNESGQVRLRQVKFTESARTKNAILQITLPDRSSGETPMDQSIPFYVLALPDDKNADFMKHADNDWTEEELQQLDIGYVQLELISRGVGELIVRAPQMYHTILPGETAEMTIELVNEGSRRLDHIEIKADPPLNWSKDIDPVNINTLDIGDEAKVRLAFTPPDDIAVGKYEVRIKSSGLSDGRPITASDKIVAIEIRSETNLLVAILIVFFILAIVGGMVTYGVKLSRK